MDYFVTQKMTWNDTNQLPFKLFWWESPDGSKVLAYFPHDYVNTTMNPVRLAEDLKKARERSTGMTEMMDLYGVGDHGGGPTRAILDEGFHWAGPGHVTPKYEFGHGAELISHRSKSRLRRESPEWNYQSIAKGYEAPPAVAGEVSIPTWKSELYFEYHRGVMTTQANHKSEHARQRRGGAERGEVGLVGVARWHEVSRRLELTEDWKKVLFNQFHDLAAGSGIGVIYKDAQKDYDVVRWSTNEISAKSAETISSRVDTAGEGIPVVVYNPLGWERSGEVKVNAQLPSTSINGLVIVDPAAGKQPRFPIRQEIDTKSGVAHLTFYVSSVPALGYKVVRLVAQQAGRSSRQCGTGSRVIAIQLANDKLSLAVDKKTGCITSLEAGRR